MSGIPSHTGASPAARYDLAQLRPALHGPVLLAADGVAPTDAAALAAIRIGRAIGEEVQVVSVLEPLPIVTTGFDAPLLPPSFESDRLADLENTVRARLEPLLGPPGQWKLHLRFGRKGREIARVASELAAGIVVVGSGGHRLRDRFAGEDVALGVVRHATVPVLAVQPNDLEPPRRAVVGVDFGAASIRAAQVATALLAPADPGHPATLTLVHARSPLEDDAASLAAWSGEYDTSVGSAFGRLRQLLRPILPEHVTIETRVVARPTDTALVDAADELSATLIAVGTHGPGWMERLLVGSTATATLRESGRTVLVAPTPPAAARVRLELQVHGRVALDQRTDWQGALDTLTRRNLGRIVRLEVDGAGIDELTVQATRARFLGATYDPHDGRVEILLGGQEERASRLVHTVQQVRSVEILAADERHDALLLVEGAHSHAVITFTT